MKNELHNMHGIDVGDCIDFVNKLNYSVHIEIAKIGENSVWTSAGNRESWGTINGYLKNPLAVVTKALKKMEIKLTGRLLKFTYSTSYMYDTQTTIGIEVDREVIPLALAIMREVEKFSSVEKSQAMRRNKLFDFKINANEKEDLIAGIAWFEFEINGWEINDEDAQKSDSGVNVDDTFKKLEKNSAVFETLAAYIGKEVEINISR